MMVRVWWVCECVDEVCMKVTGHTGDMYLGCGVCGGVSVVGWSDVEWVDV